MPRDEIISTVAYLSVQYEATIAEVLSSPAKTFLFWMKQTFLGYSRSSV